MMQIKFLHDWQGSRVGDIGEFVPFITEDLIERKIAEPYVDESNKDSKIRKQAAEITKLRRQLKATKQIDAAPRNKQLTGAANK